MEIYVMNADGSEQKNLSNHGNYDTRAAWSPDGSKIAFDRNIDRNFEIYVMNADGSEQKNLSTSVGNDLHADWSPNGTKIAFSSTRDGNFEIYVMNADGTNPTNISNNPYEDVSPDWEPIPYDESIDIPEEPIVPEPDDNPILETQGKCDDVTGVPATTSAEELIQFGISSFDPNDVKNLGCEVSKIAQLHEYLSSEDKAEREKFKKLFHEFMGDVKTILGKGQGMKVLALEQVLKKGEQKLNAKYSQIEDNKIKEHKLKTAPDLVNKRKDLVKTKNLIGVLNHFLNDGPDKDKILEELGKKKIGLQKAVLITDAEHNGKKITTEFLTKVDEKIANENKPTPSSDHNDKDNKGKSQKSNNGKSDKGNNGKSNKGKGKSK